MLPNPIFEVFGLKVYMYGVMIAVGLLCCLGVFYFYTKKKGMPEKVQDFVFAVAIVAIAIGFLFAKLYQAVYNWMDTGVFNFYKAGITVMGGLIGGAGAFILTYFLAGRYMFKGKDKGIHVREFNKIVQVAPICITIAHAFGRLGCMCAGCCYGKVTEKGFFLFSIYNHGAYRVPVQLYEALFLFALFGVLTYLYFHRCNITMSIYLIAYGVWRLIIEFFRVDSRGAIILGLSPSQWQSFLFIAGGIALIIIYIWKKIPLFYKKEDIPIDKVSGVTEELAEEQDAQIKKEEN